MNPALEKLAKFLRLEAERGFDDRAVFGGLGRALEPWQSEARAAGLPEPVVEAVVARLRDYATLSPASRRQALHGLAERLADEFPEFSDAVPPPAAPGDGGEPADERPDSLSESGSRRAPPSAASQTGEGAQAERPPAPRAAARSVDLDSPLTVVPGIGPKSARMLHKLNLETLRDLLWHLPRRYDDYSQLKTINRLWYGEDVTVIGTVEDVQVRPVRGKNLKLVEATVSDGTGSLRLTWFNQPWIAERLDLGRAVVLSGKVEQYLGRLTMNSPEWEPVERSQLHTHRIVPVYPLTTGVTAKWLRRVIHSLVTRMAPRVPDPLPESVRQAAGLLPLGEALQQIHFPDSWEALRKAQDRLAFDEMFLLQLGVLRQKRSWESLRARPLPVERAWLEKFVVELPFPLTQAQRRALDEIRGDLSKARPMNRLLQGEVGSGKTVVAAAAVGMCAANGAQSAVMAPTSILAEQHLHTLRQVLPAAAGMSPDSIQLLIGATPESEKAEIRAGLADGRVAVVVGTHALLEEPVQFARLELAVIDEQHRFGVAQRAALRAKGDNPHLLVMTATPIPRTLQLTIFGDLDLTLIDEMPPGREPVETRVIDPAARSRAHRFVERQLEAGRQAFIIYPLVEGSDKVEAKAAVDEQERLQKEVFPQYKVGLLHGRMRPEDKEEAMARFRAGEQQVLVSTSVVEVGVDVPNATTIVIEGANRFGLAQLHQFRGRVRRSQHKAYCLLIPDSAEESDNERLKALERTHDGFELAEMDLEQRGPGQFLGTRQSGFAELRLAPLTDLRLIERARREATRLLEVDPGLQAAEHRALAQAVEQFWSSPAGEIS